jgi:hypothetical protein
MVLPTEQSELISAWRALAGVAEVTEGWRTISLSLAAPSRFRAGRHFPGNEEALLVGFNSIHVLSPEHLPQGQGFLVSKVELGMDLKDKIWIALSRRSAGTVGMFTIMALDIIATLKTGGAMEEDRLFHLFVSRIRAWQQFMHRSMERALQPEAEIGLFGELVFLHSMIEAGLHPAIAIEAWIGPLDGLQDFVLGAGAIEVKTSLASTGFPARIGCLDQLDNSVRQPLFLAAVRVRLDDSGASLPGLVENTRALLANDSGAQNSFNIKLLHAGYLDAASEEYKRRFGHVRTKIFLVTDSFPRRTRAYIRPEILEVRYELDLDRVLSESVPPGLVLQQLGAI